MSNQDVRWQHEEIAEAILSNIQRQHHPLLKALEETMLKRIATDS